MKLEISQAADEEAGAAADWYNAQRRGLGTDFLEALDRLLARVVDAPESYSRVEDYTGVRDLRQGLLRPFPYKVIFEAVSQEKLIVLAVAHTSRRPGYWRDRLA